MASSPGCRSVKLSKYVQDQFVEGRTQGYRLYVEASDPVGMTKHLFVYQLGGIDPDTGARTSSFVAIASPSDIEEYPVGGPGDGDRFYRLHAADLVFRARADAESAWGAIKSDVNELIQTLNLMDSISLSEEVVLDGSG